MWLEKGTALAVLFKRRIDSKSSPHFTIEVKSDTEVIFKVHKKVQFNQ